VRQGQQNRRGRGRPNNNGNHNNQNNGNRKHQQNPLSRSFESNGPDVKVRGTPAHIAEKYLALARDAQTSGDPVLAENYFQHAEHYNRIIMAYREQLQQPGDPSGQQPRRIRADGSEEDDQGDEDGNTSDAGGDGSGGFNAGSTGFQPQNGNQTQGGGYNGRPQNQQRHDRDRQDRSDRGGDRGGDRSYDGQPREDRQFRQNRDQNRFRSGQNGGQSNGQNNGNRNDRGYEPRGDNRNNDGRNNDSRNQEGRGDGRQDQQRGGYRADRPADQRRDYQSDDQRGDAPRNEARGEPREFRQGLPTDRPPVDRVERAPVAERTVEREAEPAVAAAPVNEAVPVAPAPRKRASAVTNQDQPDFLLRPVRRPRAKPEAAPAEPSGGNDGSSKD
jgi:Domain of unknown function (DUF4167)